MVCEDCCEETATVTWDEGLDYAFWTGRHRYTPLCSDCWTRRDNREGQEPDGEDMFRDYQAEQRDAAIEAQKLK